MDERKANKLDVFEQVVNPSKKALRRPLRNKVIFLQKQRFCHSAPKKSTYSYTFDKCTNVQKSHFLPLERNIVLIILFFPGSRKSFWWPYAIMNIRWLSMFFIESGWFNEKHRIIIKFNRKPVKQLFLQNHTNQGYCVFNHCFLLVSIH